MTTTRRTDIHSPASPDFDPLAYDLIGFSDNHPEDGNRRAVKAHLQKLHTRGFRAGPGSDGQCGHCGARFRYAAILIHMLSNEWIFVGEECLLNRFSGTQEEFRSMRTLAKANRERRTIAERVATFVAQFPELATLADHSDPIVSGSEFLSSLGRQLRTKGTLSERQVIAGTRALARERERAVEETIAAEARAACPARQYLGAIGDTIEVTGEVIVAMTVDGYAYGTTQTMLVISTPIGDAKVYTSAGWSAEVNKGDVITVTATVKRLDEYKGEPQTLITRAKRRA